MISKEAKNVNTCLTREYFFDSARIGFEYVLKKLLSPNEIILMPAYIGQSEKEGSGVFDPIRHTQAKVLFYELDDHLQVNEAKLFRQLMLPNIKALFVIHYFGFPQKSIFKLKSICEQRNIVLIEDCAHTLQSSIEGQRLGTIGDIALFSLHKLIATQNGGVVRINNDKYGSLLENVIENISFADLIQYAKTDILATSAIRVRNYHQYLSAISDNSPFFDVMYPDIEDGVIPLNFPIRVKNYDRFSMYNKLIDKGFITVSLYYRLIDELNRCIFPISFAVSDTILNLPVHQDTSSKDIEQMISCLNTWK